MIEMGLHTDNWRLLSSDFETACESAEKFGLDHIEFGVIHGHYFVQAMGYDPAVSLWENPREIKRYLDGKGLQVSQIDASYPSMGPKGSTFGVQYAQQGIRFAKEVGCPMIDTVDGESEIEGYTKDEVFDVAVENYRQILSWAEDYDVIVNVEPHGPYTNDLDFMKRLFEHFDSEYLGLNRDTGNTFIAGNDPLEYLKELREYVNHIHIKDVSEELAKSARGEWTGIATSEVAIGEGVNAENIRKCINYLNETDWDGVASIECYGTNENIKKSVEFLQDLL